MARRYGFLFSVVGTPIVATLAAVSYARSKPSLPAKIGTFLLLVPLVVIATVVWFLAWSFVFWLIAGLFSN